MTPQELDARLVNRWVLVHNEGHILDGDKERYDVSVDYFVGFVYVDRDAGMTIELLSYCTVDGKTITLTKGPRDDNSRSIIRWTHAQPRDMTCTLLTGEQQSALALPDEPEWLEGYKVEGQKEIDRLRRVKLLHPLRAPGFPDDIRFVLAPTHNAPVQKRFGDALSQIHRKISIS